MVENLKSLRRNKGISQQQLAEAVGVSQQSINKYENHDVEPDISTLIKMARYFNTSVDYLIGNTTVDRIIEQCEEYYLNLQEKEHIISYRKLNEDQKSSIDNIMLLYRQKNT